MSDRLNQDAWGIRKLMREAEGLTDEAIVACARLKQAMINARGNPEVRVGVGHAAVLRLTQAEQNFVAAYGNLLRVHSELNHVAIETAGIDDGVPTVFDGGRKQPNGLHSEDMEAA